MSHRMSSTSSTTERDADEVRTDTAADKCLVGELLVCCRCRTDDQCAHVTNVGEVAAQLDGFDEPSARVASAVHAEGQRGTRSERKVSLGPIVVRVVRQPRPAHSCDGRALAPCPPRSLEAEWTTMSAPHSSGRHS